MKMKKWFAAFVGFVLVLALGITAVACETDTGNEGGDGDDTTDVAVTGVSLDKTSLELLEGETAVLTATVTPDNATDKTVSWISSAQSVATVSETGTVTAVSVGRATITATAGGVSATCVVTVSEEGISVTDTQSLFEAVETAEAGAIIRLTAGTYAFNDNLYIDKSLTLSGSGSVVIERGTENWGTNSTGRTSLITVAADDVTIRNVTVQGAETIGSNYAHGINVWQSENVRIENVVAKDNDGVGVLVNDSSVTLSNVQTSGNGWGGVNVDTGEASGITSLTLESGCSFAEVLAIYCDSAAMAENVEVTAAGYHEATVTLAGSENVVRHVWTTNEAITDGSFIAGDAAGLRNAVAAAPAGSKIVLVENTYALNANLALDKALTIEGIGEVVIEKGTGAWETNSAGRTSLITIAADDVTIRNVTVQGAETIGSNYAHGINVWQSENVRIENVVAKDNDGVGVLVNDSSVTLSNVQTSGNGWGGVNVDTGSNTNDTSLTVDAACAFGEAFQIYCDSKTMAEEITVTADGYTAAETADQNENMRYVWTKNA